MNSADAWASVSTPYVKPRQPGDPDPWAAEAAAHGHEGTHRLLDVATAEPPLRVSAALGLSPGELAVIRRRLVLLDDQPVELADSYYPAAFADGTRLADKRKIPGGAPALLASLGFEVGEVIEDIEVRLATEPEREILQLATPTPVLELTRIVSAQDGRPIEVGVMTMLPGRRLRYLLRIGSSE